MPSGTRRLHQKQIVQLAVAAKVFLKLVLLAEESSRCRPLGLRLFGRRRRRREHWRRSRVVGRLHKIELLRLPVVVVVLSVRLLVAEEVGEERSRGRLDRWR